MLANNIIRNAGQDAIKVGKISQGDNIHIIGNSINIPQLNAYGDDYDDDIEYLSNLDEYGNTGDISEVGSESNETSYELWGDESYLGVTVKDPFTLGIKGSVAEIG